MITLDSPPRSDSPESSDLQITTRWITDSAELETLVPAWQKLVQNGLLTNPAYEPEFLIPLFKHRNNNARLLIAERRFGEDRASEDRANDILALIPIVERKFYGLPFRCFHAWRPDEAFDATPLLHRDHAPRAFGSLIDTLKIEGARLLSLDTVSASAEFESVLFGPVGTAKDHSQGSVLTGFQRARFSRPALRPLDSADDYIGQSTSKNRRKKTRRLRRNLEAIGDVRFEHTDPSSDFHAWAEDFVDLEASGWKGRNNSAIASRPETLAFFLEMVERFAARNAIRFGKLTLDSVPIAMLCDIVSGQHVSAFKVAFDERHSENSPGFLLELENIRWLHQLDCGLCDSCTSPDNELLGRLYNDQLPFQSIVLGLDDGMKSYVEFVMPAIQRTARIAKKLRSLTQR